MPKQLLTLSYNVWDFSLLHIFSHHFIHTHTHTDAPVITPRNTTRSGIAEGASAELSCAVVSQPAITYVDWSRDDGLAMRQHQSTFLMQPSALSRLRLQNVTRDDMGWYSCQASNGVGDITISSAFLYVKCLFGSSVFLFPLKLLFNSQMHPPFNATHVSLNRLQKRETWLAWPV